MATVTLTLAPPSTRKDGSAFAAADLVRFRVSRNGAFLGNVDASGPFTFVDLNVTPGNYAYTATVVDVQGNESDPSAPFSVEVKVAPPSPPTVLSAVVS